MTDTTTHLWRSSQRRSAAAAAAQNCNLAAAGEVDHRRLEGEVGRKRTLQSSTELKKGNAKFNRNSARRVEGMGRATIPSSFLKPQTDSVKTYLTSLRRKHFRQAGCSYPEQQAVKRGKTPTQQRTNHKERKKISQASSSWRNPTSSAKSEKGKTAPAALDYRHLEWLHDS